MLTLQEYQQQEQELTLKRFKRSDAFTLGSYISQKAIENNYGVEVYIEVNGQCIYRYVNEGASENNHSWITKKGNVIKRFNHASGFIAAKYSKMTYQQLVEAYGSDLAITPGAFPIILENAGVIGIVGVSGLASDDDHQLIIDGLTYLKKVQENVD